MSLAIHNMGASIRFMGNEGDKLVMKTTIKTISIIRQETIRIDVSETHKAIAFRHAEVTDPITGSARDLALLLNGMITECVCCNCTAEEYSVEKNER